VDAPTTESYWVAPGELLAGKYPGLTAFSGESRLQTLLAAGVTLFLDLTEEHELDPYAHELGGAARHVRMPIPDMGVATGDQMRRTLDLIDRERARRGTTYVHCWGGAGRTGTVVGCWLVRHGLGGDEALTRIAGLRAGTPALWLDSPQTDEQREMVRRWVEIR
jgi:rhodanese/phosphatase family protein